jgi:uncharacterized membrane protein (DUF2068 family)
VREVKLDPQNHHIHTAIEKLTGVSRRQLQAFSVGTLIYASLFYIEGIGLLFRKRWAEYMTVITTAVFLPLEIYEVTRHFSAVKFAVLIANAAVVAYLIVRLWRTRPSSAGPPEAPRPASQAP